MRGGDLRRHRRSGPQEADAGDLRPGQPRAAAADVRAGRVRPPRLGGRGLRQDRATTRSRSTPARRSARRCGTGSPRESGSSRARSTTTTPFAQLAETLDKLDAERGTGGNHAFYLSIPPKAFPTVLRAAARSPGWPDPQAGRWSRVVIEKPFGHDLQSADRAQQGRQQRLPRGVGVPHRPLPRQGDGAEHPGAALRQRAVRADLEQPLRRPRADHHGRGHRPRRPGRLLRRHRRRPRRHPEPPAPAAGADRDGGAGQLPAPRGAGREDQGALGHPAGPAAGPDHLARPVHRRLAGRREGGRAARRGGLLQGRRPPRRSPRSRSRSTPAAGPGCRSTCAPENGWAAG